MDHSGMDGDVNLFHIFIKYQRQYFAERGWEWETIEPSLGQTSRLRPQLAVFRRFGESSQLATFPGQIHCGDAFGVSEMESLHRLARDCHVDRAFLLVPQKPAFRDAVRAAGDYGWRHRGYICDLRADLAAPLGEIFSGLRKKYRQQIRKYSSDVELSVDSSALGVTWLQVLHREVAGRSTRSNVTWDLMRSAADSGFGFTVLAKAGGGQIVGALYVMHTTSHALAFSAAYRRDLMAGRLPLGHLCEWTALSHLKQETGVASYSTLRFDTANVNDDKFLNILRFKEGLAVSHHLVERLEYLRG